MILFVVLGAENVTQKIVSPPVDEYKGLMVTLIIFLIINIIALIAKYFFDKALKKQDVKISKKIAITEISIKTEAELFLKIEYLKNFQKGESHIMLDSIIEIEEFLVSSQLYICKKIIALTNDSLDYYKKVVSNFNEKDIKKEKEFTKKFSEHYYGE